MEQTTLSLRYAALSDVGRVRKDNQDSGFASEHLLLIADGVGGAARGDIASSTAVHIIRRLDAPAPEDMLEALAGALHRTHDRLAELVEQDPEIDGTSTTVTAALFDGKRIGVAHIGDSRGYLLRNGELSQLTRDHTFVQSLIDEGRITEEEARTHPHRNLILRAVDGVHETDPDLFLLDVVPGDRILLCSDGCSGVLDHGRLADILSTGSVDYSVVELVRASLDAGSSDNVTCVVADVVDPATTPNGALMDTSGGPMVVGAAAEQPRRAGSTSKSFFRGHRGGDTGELDPVPADLDEDFDPEELRYAPRAPRRFVWLRRFAMLGLVVLLAALLAFLAYRWTQNQYYVAAHGDRVAIYKGVQAKVPGLTMTSVAMDTPVTLESLPQYNAEQVRTGIGAEGMDDAKNIVSRLHDLAKVCPTPKPTPTASPNKASKSPSAKPTSKRSGRHNKRASGGTSNTPKPTQSPSAKPSPTIKPPHCIKASS
jgi:protein phosphatase